MRDFFNNMATSQNNYWGHDDLNRVCFGLSADLEQNMKELPQRHVAKDLNSGAALSQSSFYSDTFRLSSDNALLSIEGDQVVPSSHKRSLFGGHPKEPKPLPPLPLPDHEDLMSDEAADCEVEFFTSDRQRLLPKSCPKTICQSSKPDYGLVNYAYQERSMQDGMASVASSWPCREHRAVGREGHFGANMWTLAYQGEDNPSRCSPSDSTALDRNMDKPQVPPRIPIPPKPSSLLNTWGSDTKPPKIPPRVPLVPPCPPRTPSPKSLPIYINGVMPATQSFAANPKYVSKALQRQQNERVTPETQQTPRILPILKDGRQASATHYILLPPGRRQQSERRDRLLSDPSMNANLGGWQRR